MSNPLFIWLDRIGIILNFIAGFCLAPELIGLNRIQRFESQFQKFIHELEETSAIIIEMYKERLKTSRTQNRNLFQKETAILGLFLIIAPVIFTFLSVLIPCILLFVVDTGYGAISNRSAPLIKPLLGWLMFVVLLGFFTLIDLGLASLLYFLGDEYEGRKNIKNTSPKKDNLIKRLVRGMINSILFGSIIFSYPLFPRIALVANSLVKKFEEENQVRSFLVWFGIFLFVLGNLLQFIATF